MTHVGVPGRAVSVGGRVERLAGDLLDAAHADDLDAARFRSYPATWAAIAGRGNGLRRAVSLLLDVPPEVVDDVYAGLYGARPLGVQGRPAGNAAGRPGRHDADPRLEFEVGP